MKKAFWLASVVGLAVAAWATVSTVSVQANGTYAAEQINSEESLARRGGGSSGGSSYGSSGGGRRQGSSYGSSGGGRRRSRGSHGSHG